MNINWSQNRDGIEIANGFFEVSDELVYAENEPDFLKLSDGHDDTFTLSKLSRDGKLLTRTFRFRWLEDRIYILENEKRTKIVPRFSEAVYGGEYPTIAHEIPVRGLVYRIGVQWTHKPDDWVAGILCSNLTWSRQCLVRVEDDRRWLVCCDYEKLVQPHEFIDWTAV